MINGHGDDLWRFGRPIVANFSSNVFGGVDLTPLKEHLAGRMEAISHYPEPEPYTLEKALAAQHGIPPECVCATNGATEAIYLIAQAWRGARSCILQPTFSEYADACRLHGHNVTGANEPPGQAGGDGTPAGNERAQAGGDDTPAGYKGTQARGEGTPAGNAGTRTGGDGASYGDAGITAGNAGPDLLWLCNPNNPDGRVIPKAQLQSLISSNPATIFVIDQSYGFFTEEPLMTPQEAIEHGNVLQLHSMTKRYAMPGLRLGYVVGAKHLTDRIRAVRMPWSVNALAIEAGLYLAANPGTAPIDKAALLREAQRLRNALNAIPGLTVAPTSTHFMLCHIETRTAAELKLFLAEHHGLLIRDASNFEGLTPGNFRIATQTTAENDLLINAIRQYLL